MVRVRFSTAIPLSPSYNHSLDLLHCSTQLQRHSSQSQTTNWYLNQKPCLHLPPRNIPLSTQYARCQPSPQNSTNHWF